MKIDNFIYTTSENSAKELILRGYQLVSNNGGIWTFMDNKKLMFTDLERVIITNKLLF